MPSFRRLLRLTTATLLCSFCTAFLPSVRGAVADSAPALIDRLRQEFNHAYTLGDAADLAGLVAEDAVWMPPGEPAVLGRDAIQARYEAQFTNVHSVLALDQDQIRVSTNMAWLRGNYERIDTLVTGGPVMTITGKYLMTFSRESGGWRITSLTWNANESPVRVEGHVALHAVRALAEWRLGDVAGSLKMLVGTDEVKTGVWKKMLGLLTSLEDTGILANAIWFVRPDGSYFTVARGFITDANLADRSYFPHLMNGESVLGALVISRSTGRRSVIIAEPVFDRTQVIGAVGVSYSVDQLSLEIDEQLGLPYAATFYALDLNGQTALHRNPALMFEYPSDMGSSTLRDAAGEMLSNASGAVTYVFPAGIRKTVLFEKSGVIEWVFAFGFSEPAIEDKY